MPTQIVPAAEFQALPLEFIVSSPLVAAVKAQAIAAQTTLDFINGTIDEATKKPKTVAFQVETKTVDDQGKEVVTSKTIDAPILSIVPVPHLRIDSLTINFKYEITQTMKDTSALDKSLSINFQTGGLLSAWASGGLKGNVSSKSSEESTMNRSGTLEITVHASESDMPEGLAKVLGMLSNSIPA